MGYHVKLELYVMLKVRLGDSCCLVTDRSALSLGSSYD